MSWKQVLTVAATIVVSPALAQSFPAQSTPRADIEFDQSAHRVTITLPSAALRVPLPANTRRESFMVFEDGVRQSNPDVRVEHGPVSLGVLLENGSPYRALEEAIDTAVAAAARQLLDQVTQRDSVRVWTYGSEVQELSDAAQGGDGRTALIRLPGTVVSETNFFDALSVTLSRLQEVGAGTKALLVIATGVDTFSKAGFEDALRAAQTSGIPIFAVDVVPAVRAASSLQLNVPPYTRLNWQRAHDQLHQIVKASGGRLYSPPSVFDLSGIYDDLMDSLRTRYIITYTSNSQREGPRLVRVEVSDQSLVSDPKAAAGAMRKPPQSSIIVEDTYRPKSVAPG